MKKISKFLKILLLLSILVLTGATGYDMFMSPDPVGVTESLSLEFNDIGDLDSLQCYINALGEIARPPANGADARIEDGNLRLEISPLANFDQLDSKFKPGQAAAEQYNNLFCLTKAIFGPTKKSDVWIKWRAKVDQDYKGSQNLQVESADTFTKGRMTHSWGFPGLFGAPFFSEESGWPMTGVNYVYTIGFAPVCILPVEDIDPYEWNEYEIRWSKGGRFSGYVNGRLIGHCIIPLVAFDTGDLQGWVDTYDLDSINVGFLNAPKTQGMVFDWIRIQMMPK